MGTTSQHTFILKTCLSICWIFTFSFFVAIQAQTYTIKGIITDKTEQNIRIPDVKIFFKSNPKNLVHSNSKGEYSLTFECKETDTLVFFHAGFETLTKIFTPKSLKNYPNKIIIFNPQLSSPTLFEHTVRFQKVDTVFGNVDYSVQDYLLLNDKKMLLLVYNKTAEKGTELWYTDANQKAISTYSIPQQVRQLFTDYAKNNYLVCQKSVFLINIRNHELFLRTVSLEDFYGFHNRILDTIQENYYYSDYNALYPAVQFFCTQRNDTTQHLLREVKDDFMMELYRAQYKYVSGRDKLWAYRKEQETGIDKEIWIGAQSFTQDILYKPVYAPFFVVNDTVLIFDQYKSYLYKFSDQHVLLDSVFVNYYNNAKGEKWEQPLIKDETTGLIYALYNRAGYNYIRLLDIKTGLLTVTTKLTNRFVSNIKIKNGFVYYIYRPYESQQKKFLYKEKL